MTESVTTGAALRYLPPERSRALAVQRNRDGVEIVLEELRVCVEGHRRARMPQHPLNRLDVRSRADRERSGSVAQIARGLSQEQFAHALRYDRTYVASVERGERNLTLDTVSDLANRLGVDALRLLQEP